mmetsp:Transcript_31040/g.35453  ORF Transcript_31040/g.35453 Transcript_31040/m.35453 type:complete len:114 (+) Transcript_31040:1099-1440(+)
MDLLYRINWKIPMITIKHFVDHYKRILPEFDKEDNEGLIEITRFSKYFTIDREMQSELSTVEMKDMFKACRAEIMECIDAISKLCPLMPDYINYKTKDISISALVVSIKHSLK